MKRLLSLLLVVLVTVGASAQNRKYWDFRTLSQETIDNLVADPATWTITNKDDGTFDRAADAKKISGELTANGVPIKELQGLTFGTAGLSNSSNFMIATNRFRMTRNNMEIIFPKLAPGQTVTVRGRSANGSKSDRGFKSGNDNLEYISGPKDGLCIGNQVEGYGSADYPVEEDGNYTLVWKVREDLGTTDSVDVVIKMVTGGLDMAEIYIDNCNEDQVEEAKKIAYLYDSSKGNGYTLDGDPMYEIVNGSGSYEVLAVDIKDFTAEMTDTINALETNYDLVMVSEGPNSTHKFASAIKGMVNRVPMMNMKSFFYKSGVWSWGAGSNPIPSTGTIVLTSAGASHKAFKSLGLSAGDEVELWMADGYEGNIIQGYTASEGSFIENDSVLATIGDGINAIHEHGKSNIYMLFPFSSDAAIAYGAGTLAPGEDLPSLVTAVVDYLADSKSTVRQANKPAIKQINGDGVTTVEISTSVAGATIYYTTDGSEPTVASAVYTEALTFTEPAVVKAFVSAVGYNDSDVASAEVVIKGQWDAPVISLDRSSADTTVVTLTAEEGANIYFNFIGGTDSTFSQKYTEPIKLAWPATITAFAVGGNNVPSEVASEYVGINSLTAETIRLDTIAHFDANVADWYVVVDETNGTGSESAYYYWGKSAWNYYSEEVDHTEDVTNEAGEVETVTYYKPDAAAEKVVNPANENGWVIKSAGQVLTLEGKLSTSDGVGNGAANRYAEEAIDNIDGKPSTGCITFGKKNSSDPYTGRIETTVKYAGPFDVLVAAGNGSGKEINMNIEVSADGITWNKIGDVKFAGTKRYYKKTRVAYNETAEVYVRVAHVGGNTSAQVYDIFLFNNGEYSKQYSEEAQGVELPAVAGAEVVDVQIFNLSGVQQNGLGKGLNIVRKTYSNGTVEVLKVMGK